MLMVGTGSPSLGGAEVLDELDLEGLVEAGGQALSRLVPALGRPPNTASASSSGSS